jgi:hypothetical protein
MELSSLFAGKDKIELLKKNDESPDLNENEKN